MFKYIIYVEVMAITKYARTVHTGSDPQRQSGQPEAAHGSPSHPAVMNPCFSTILTIVCCVLKMQETQVAKTTTNVSNIFLSLCEK